MQTFFTNVSYSILRIVVILSRISWFTLDIVFFLLPVRHGFVNEAYDNLDAMNLAPVEHTAQPANHNQAPTQQVPSQEPVAFFAGIN